MPITERLRRIRLSSWQYRTASVALYAAIVLWLYGWRIWSNSLFPLTPGSDRVQEVWFLAWPAFALTHGHSIWFSNWMDYPRGVNMMTNTSMPLLGLLGAPITWTLGPVVTYMTFMRLGFILSAASAQFVARRIGMSRLGSLAAGLIYGFSTIQIVQGNGHLFLIFAPIPPLVFYSLYCLIIRRWSPRRAGLTAGVLLAADLLISAERALMTIVGVGVALVVAAAFNWRRIDRELVRRLAIAGAYAIGSMAVLFAYPLYEMMGRDHVSGVAHLWIQGYASDLVDFILPGRFTWLDPFGWRSHIILVTSEWENGSYIGLPLLIGLVVVTWCGWKHRLVRVAAISTLIIVGMSMGEFPRINGVLHKPYKSPYELIAHLPYLRNIEPIRFMYIAWLGIAMLAGYGLDRLLAWRHSREDRWRTARVAVAVAVPALVLASLAPAAAYPMVPSEVPALITSPSLSKVIPTDSVVLFYPYPNLGSNHAMLDQAVADMPFKIIGGEGLIGNAKGVNISIEPLKPLALPTVFLRTWYNQPTGLISILELDQTLPSLPPLDHATVAAFHEFIVRNHVSTILMEDTPRYQMDYVMPYLVAAFGPPTVYDDGQVHLWDRAQLRAHTR